MSIIKLDNYTTIPAPTELHESKYYWELFPYDAEIDMVDWSYGGQPMSEEQISFMEEYRKDFTSIYDCDENLSRKIIQRTEVSLLQHGVSPSSKHRDILRRMSMIMSSNTQMHSPRVITSRPGLGKTQMLIAALVEKIIADPAYTAIVVTNRIQDAVDIANSVNRQSDSEACWVRSSFSLETLHGRCQNGYVAKDYKPNICRSENCAKQTCPVKGWANDFWKRKVVLISSRFLNINMDMGTLTNLMRLGHMEIEGRDDSLRYLFELPQGCESLPVYRRELIIDENPGTLYSGEIKNGMLNDCFVHLKRNKFKQHLIDEYRVIRMYVSDQIGGEAKYEHTHPDCEIHPLSSEFVRAWYETPPKNHFNMPYVINRFIEQGGIRQNGAGEYEYLIGVGKYRDFKDLPFQVTILDGTGIRDKTYRQDEFYIYDIPEIRDMSRATLHRYPRLLSKTFLSEEGKKKQRLDGLASEAVRVLGDRPSLLITNLDFEKSLMTRLVDSPNIMVDHFGNLIGTNKYSECEAVFFAGLQEWRPIDYFLSSESIIGSEVDLEFDINQDPHYVDPVVQHFRETQLALSIYQDIMRSSLRNPGSAKPVDIYLWTNDTGILEILRSWLPGINQIDIDLPDELRTQKQPSVMSTWAKIRIDKHKASLPEKDLPTGPTGIAHFLADCLDREPTRAEVQYFAGHVDNSNFHRIPTAARKYLRAKGNG